MRESHVHDVQITKEAPNYRVEYDLADARPQCAALSSSMIHGS